MNNELIKIGELAKKASFELIKVSTNVKNDALIAMAKALIDNSDKILDANKIDLGCAREKGIKEAMIDRLALSKDRISQMVDGIMQIVALPDPIGEVLSMWTRPNGLEIGQKRVPLGVIGIIYESRPNVTADAAALCLKTSNAVILRGGSEAINSNKAIVDVMNKAIIEAGMPEGSLALIEDTSREVARDFMRLSDYVDVLIPRGGAGLIKTVLENATIPVIETGTGNCHTFVDSFANLKMAQDIAVNAKCSRPSVCNAMETLLVDSHIAAEFLPKVAVALGEYNVELRGCEKTRMYIEAKVATEEDWYTEYNDFILAIKVVEGIDEAIAHINKYNTKHSEAIVTDDYNNARRFLNEIDAAAVYVNASTRFTDGNEFGFGGEIGISNQKMHARGPMGLNALTTIKYIIFGNGQIR